MTVDLSKVAFYSEVNYMKRDVEFCGSTTLTLPAYGDTVSYEVEHNMEFIPFYTVNAEIDEADTIWTGGKISELSEQFYLSGLFQDPTYPILSHWTTTTTLTIQLDNTTSPTATGDRVIYWLIYKDYGDVS